MPYYETLVLVLAGVLGVIAVALTVVVTLYHRMRREQMTGVMPAQPEVDITSTPRGARLMNTTEKPQDALGWASSEPSAASDDLTEEFEKQQVAVLGRQKTILVADDDPVVLFALTRRLQQMGYQVMRSPDAAHALLGVMKVLPDLVILDINMPSGNGLAVCEMITCDQRCAHIPVIVHTAFSDDAVIKRCEQLGAHLVEKSPRSWTDIKAMVEKLLGDSASSASHPEETVAESDVYSAPSASDEGQMQTSEQATPAAESAAASTEAAAHSGRRLVLCFESPAGQLDKVEHQLHAIGIEVMKTSDLEEGFWTCFTEKPSAIIVQIADNKKGLIALLTRIAQHPVTRLTPVMVINENDLLTASDLPSGGKIKILKSPVDCEDLLCELEAYFPSFHHDDLTSPAKAATPVAKSGKAASAATSQPAATADATPMLTILCVDDDPVVARSIANRLQPYPIKLRWANNGTQGYMLAVTEKPDLVLLDLKMPNGEGNYVLTKIKENPQTEHIPVIVLTVETHKGVRRQMFAIGADAYLNKPIQWPELFAEMGRCVRLPKQLLHDYKLKDQLSLAEL